MNRKIVLGILAHVDAGKTTLSESLLYHAGIIRKPGRVDTKDTYLDTDSVERQRGITIYTKLARIPMQDGAEGAEGEFILIDTPGHVDFSAEMERALSVMDVAVLLVSATAGVQPHTKTLWRLLRTYHIPTFIFVNKMDMPGADSAAVLKELNRKLSAAVTDFTEAATQDNGVMSTTSSATHGDPATAAFYEELATNDEDLLEEFLETGLLKDASVCRAINERKVFPVFFGSALKDFGVVEFMEGLRRFVPKTNTEEEAPFCARVYKITRDRAGNRITFLKVLSGALKVKSLLNEEKVNEIRRYNGEKYEVVKEAEAGDIVAVTGLLQSKNGLMYGHMRGGTLNTQQPILAPALSYAVHFPRDVDKNKMLGFLRELEDEDPSLSIEYREQTGEIYAALMGEVQTEVLKQTIMDRYEIAVTFADGKICYKETIDASGIGVGHFEPLRHYAEVQLRLEPLETGSGMEYETELSEDVLDRNWQRLIVQHMGEKEHRGPLMGAPITDIRLTLVAGRAHIKHTEGGDFRQATYRAIRQGLMELRADGHVRLLEPFYDYTLELPDSCTGRAMTDIQKMCGTANIAETDYENHITILTGRAPVSTMNGYMQEVTAYTKGLGNLSLVLAGYDFCHNEEEVLAASKYNPEADKWNTGDSVFCSHGAGTVIPWYDVPLYKHLQYEEGGVVTLTSEDSGEAERANRLRREREERIAGNAESAFISVEEVDRILRSSTHANVNAKKEAAQDTLGGRRYDMQRSGGGDGPSGNAQNASAPSTQPVYRPQTHKDRVLLVDGYNYLHADRDSEELMNQNLDAATSRLNDILDNYAAITGTNVIVVYDAYRVPGHTLSVRKQGLVTVVYTKEAQTADNYIERYAHENAQKYDITVVTSDGLLQNIVAGAGCFIMSSRAFAEELDRGD